MNMKIIKSKILWIAAFSLLLLSCSKDSEVETMSDTVAVTFSASIEGEETDDGPDGQSAGWACRWILW